MRGNGAVDARSFPHQQKRAGEGQDDKGHYLVGYLEHRIKHVDVAPTGGIHLCKQHRSQQRHADIADDGIRSHFGDASSEHVGHHRRGGGGRAEHADERSQSEVAPEGEQSEV